MICKNPAYEWEQSQKRNPFFGDYRIMMLDADYQYALVGGSSEKYLWILSRTPQLEESTKALILAEAERRGYKTNKLIWVKQSAQ